MKVFVILGMLLLTVIRPVKGRLLYFAFGFFYFLILALVFYNSRFSLFLLAMYIPLAVWPFTGPSYGVFYVDYQGNRYVNEGDRRDVCANAAVATGFPSTYSLFTMDVVAGYARPEEVEEGVALGRVLKGDTLEELAEKMNGYAVKGQTPQVTAENLKNSIERHNKFIDTQVDEDFGKNMAATMVKIEKGPYYALPQFPSVHHTMGGLVVTKQLEVKDIYGNIIPGLYASGEVTGGVHGTNRLGSNADADAVGNGYISGYFVATGKMPDFIPAE